MFLDSSIKITLNSRNRHATYWNVWMIKNNGVKYFIGTVRYRCVRKRDIYWFDMKYQPLDYEDMKDKIQLMCKDSLIEHELLGE